MLAGRVRGRKLFGKFRGIVVDNVDPTERGRVRVSVPGALGAGTAAWAEACMPPVEGLLAAPPPLPAIGSAIWVEFEEGDAARPIWTGKFWPRPGDVPAPPTSITLGTENQATLTIGDSAGRGLMLRTASGAMIVVNDAGITLSNGKGASIELVGPSVSINGGALMVI